MTIFCNQISFLIQFREKRQCSFTLSERTYRIVTNFHLGFPYTALLFSLHQAVQLMCVTILVVYGTFNFFSEILWEHITIELCFSAFLFWIKKLMNGNLTSICRAEKLIHKDKPSTSGWIIPSNFWTLDVLLCLSLLCSLASANTDNESFLTDEFL